MDRIVEENGVKCPDDFIKIITPLGYLGTAKYAISLGVNITEKDFIDTALRYIAKEYELRIPLKEHVKQKLTELKKNGHSLNILTASPHSVLDVCLKRVGVYDLFDNIWSSDDFEYTKAEPEIYTEAAKRLGVKLNECYFADDNINALATAKKAGVNTIGVYDKSSEDLSFDIRRIADRYILDFSEL
jgi:HAD superfamily hydrolase (TIGR01509 family)